MSTWKLALVPSLLMPVFASEPTVSELAVMERFATKPTARVTWSKEIDRIDDGQTVAAITALVVEDAPAKMRGIRIDLTSGNAKDTLYLSEEYLGLLVKALDEVSLDLGKFANRRSAGSTCIGSGVFLEAMRAGAHIFFASQCQMADGWSGLSVTTGERGGAFRFANVTPARFSAAVARARDELKSH